MCLNIVRLTFIMIDIDRITELITELGWEETDDIRIEIGGTAVSGIHQAEGANAKWAKPFGTVSRQKDAFLVIKNRTRNQVVPSISPES